jgi:hypothetical protein
MRKASEIIHIARTDPRYLTDQYWLCFLLSDLCREGTIELEEYETAREAIDLSLGCVAYLRTLLRCNGSIPHNADERSAEYPAHAHAYWDRLISGLSELGQ